MKKALLFAVLLGACGPNWDSKPSKQEETPVEGVAPQITVFIENNQTVVNDFKCEFTPPTPPAPVEPEPVFDAGIPEVDAGTPPLNCTTFCVRWSTESKCDNGWHGDKPKGKPDSKEGKRHCRVTNTCIEEVELCQ